MKDITEEIYEDVDRGLDKAAKFTKEKLEAASPGEETIKKAWEVEFKYTNVRYIYNTATRPKIPGDKDTSGEGNIPIVHICQRLNCSRSVAIDSNSIHTIFDIELNQLHILKRTFAPDQADIWRRRSAGYVGNRKIFKRRPRCNRKG